MTKIRLSSEIVVLIGLFGLAAFFATWHLSESPSVWYDEGIYIHLATNVAAGDGMTFQFAPGELVNRLTRVTISYPFIYPLALALKIFGPNILAARGLMV